MPQEVRPPAFLAHSTVVNPRAMTTRERLWLLAAAVLVPVAIFFQQFALDLRSQTLASAPRELVEREDVYEPGVAELTVSSKLAVKVQALVERGRAESERPPPEVLQELEQIAITRAERMRLALVAGELLGREEALRRLNALEQELTPGGELLGEVAWFKQLYADKREEMPHEVRHALLERHGWFAELALFKPGEISRARRDALSADGLIAVSTVGGLFMFGALVAGIGALIVGIVRWRRGHFEMRMEKDAPGGRVYLELFTLFVGGFALLASASLVLFGFNIEDTGAAVVVQEVMLWGLVVALAWPLFAKKPWKLFAWDVGLHRGAGPGREVLVGVLGWLAAMPLTLVLSILIALFVAEAEESGASGYPLFESPRGSTWGFVLVGLLSAVLWAPLVEEIVFRGALYRYLRPRLRWGWCVLITAAVFGLIHPYSPSGLLQVGVSGLMFGFLREWRGSLIAPMTAHFLHNGTIAGFTVAMLLALE
jgi:membrane protease YdiL (CAAX protease family)